MVYEKAKADMVSLENEDVVTASMICDDKHGGDTPVDPGDGKQKCVFSTPGLGIGCIAFRGLGTDTCNNFFTSITGDCTSIGWLSVDVSENEGFDEEE